MLLGGKSVSDKAEPLFDVLDGSCQQCFLVLDPELSYVDQSSLPLSCSTLPALHIIRIPSRLQDHVLATGTTISGITNGRLTHTKPSIYSLSRRVSISDQNYLIMGGINRTIQYWSFSGVQQHEWYTIQLTLTYI
eukprot:9433507-Ditylum_brightwellii.AAC.1